MISQLINITIMVNNRNNSVSKEELIDELFKTKDKLDEAKSSYYELNKNYKTVVNENQNLKKELDQKRTTLGCLRNKTKKLKIKNYKFKDIIRKMESEYYYDY
jgi:chromosome segregation ATPase